MTYRRGLVALALPVLLVTCSGDLPSGTGGPGFATIALRAEAPPSLEMFAPGLVVEQVRAVLLRSAGQNVDTLGLRTLPFGVDINSLDVSFSLIVAGEETLTVVVEYQTSTGQVLFVASQQVLVQPGESGPAPALLQPLYVGPGGNIALVNLSPLDSVLSAGDSLPFDASAIDSAQAPVPTFYASWSTSDPRVTINALGLVRAPDLTKVITITAVTPNGTSGSTSLTILGSEGLGLTPDSVEKLPGGTQQFSVTVGGLRTSVFIWSVNGVDGGNTTFGTIDAAGFYTAPSAVPSPSRFDVCARDTTRPGVQGCATVVITSVPSAGADVIVFNDINFLADYEVLPGNARLVRNFVTFQNTLPRSNGTQVVHEYSHASLCLATAECDQFDLTEMNATITAAGLQVAVYDTISRLPTTLPPQVKAIFIWTPQRAYDTLEINTLKAFAAQGGRIIFLGERVPYYGQFNIDSVENRFFRDMGAQLTNTGADVALASPYIVPKSGIRAHQTTAGVDSLGFDAASIVNPGPNDFALVVDVLGQQVVLGAVAKIDLTPLPAPPVAVRDGSPARRGSIRGPLERAGTRR